MRTRHPEANDAPIYDRRKTLYEPAWSPPPVPSGSDLQSPRRFQAHRKASKFTQFAEIAGTAEKAATISTHEQFSWEQLSWNERGVRLATTYHNAYWLFR